MAAPVFMTLAARPPQATFRTGVELVRLDLLNQQPCFLEELDLGSNRLGKIENLDKNDKKTNKQDLAYSLQETAFAMLVEAAERALAHTGKSELVLGGGVACNSRLQEMCQIMCRERGAKFFVPSNDLLTDNGSMIAYLGEILFKNGDLIPIKDIDKVDIAPRQRTDDVEIKYK